MPIYSISRLSSSEDSTTPTRALPAPEQIIQNAVLAFRQRLLLWGTFYLSHSPLL